MGGNGETESRTPFIKSLLGASVPPEQNPMFVCFSYDVKIPSLAQEVKNYFWIHISKDLSSNYFFLISNKSTHSIKICLTEITALHGTQTETHSKRLLV